MTDYSDVPKINTLYQQQQTIRQGIASIDEGGNLSSISLSAPPSPMGMVMGATITLPTPATPETMAAIRAQLVIYDDEITKQLSALGVTGTPPAKEK